LAYNQIIIKKNQKKWVAKCIDKQNRMLGKVQHYIINIAKEKQAYLSRIAGESMPVCNESIKNQSKE
jgi:hypothetical protein